MLDDRGTDPIQFQYSPIIQWKAAEKMALEYLSEYPESRSVIPIIEPVTPKAGTTVADSLARFDVDLAVKWSGPVLIDDRRLAPGTRIQGKEPISFLCDRARTSGSELVVPVTSPSRGREAVATAIEAAGELICVRYGLGDLTKSPSSVEGFFQSFEWPRRKTILMLDFGSIAMGDTGTLEYLGSKAMQDLGDLSGLVVMIAAGAFPKDITDVTESRGIVRLPRIDLDLFRSLKIIPSSADRLVFSDYCVGYPGPTDPQTESHGSAANVRYASEKHWLVARSTLRRRNQGIYDLCDNLVQQPEFSGPGYSQADGWVMDMARREGGPGNAMQWRAYWTLRHMLVTVRTLSS